MVRVYLLSNNDLFGQGVMNLLRLESEIEIVGRGAELDKAFEEIRQLLPEAVIVESNDLIQDSVLIVTRLLKTETPVKVIGLDLKENRFHLYHREQREARGIEDLVDALKTELSPQQPYRVGES
ncbi:MAG: response regulator transcription factor [Chloroflexi bacterium]|nr:response regulator transcription factor [Chloroflexota bacterium]